MQRISVVGLGKLGQCLAVSFAIRGFETIGIDIDQKTVDAFNKGKPLYFEPGLEEQIAKALTHKRIRATFEHEEAIIHSNVTFVHLATPSDAEGNFSNKYLESALKLLSKSLKKSRKKYHLFVINSTVMPGSCEERLIPLIEKYSGRKLDVGFGLCYCPDFVALGSAINDFLNPDIVVIGERDKRAGDKLDLIYQSFCENKPSIFRMPIIDAEITKVSLNCYIALKISFANSLANICEKIPGADVDTITKAIGRDRRIAPYYFRGGLSYGGTCFPRDTKAFIALAKKFGYDAQLIKAAEKLNEFQDRHLLELVKKYLYYIRDKKVSVLGLAFKHNTPVIIESPAIRLINELLKHKIEVSVYDPLAMENTRLLFGSRVKYAASVKDCVSRSSLSIITTQSEELKQINDSCIVHEPTVIIDCWRILDPLKLGKRVKYVTLGKADKDSVDSIYHC